MSTGGCTFNLAANLWPDVYSASPASQFGYEAGRTREVRSALWSTMRALSHTRTRWAGPLSSQWMSPNRDRPQTGRQRGEIQFRAFGHVGRLTSPATHGRAYLIR